MSLRRGLKTLVEGVLVGSGLPALARSRRGTLILAYHNIIPAGAAPAGEQSLHLPLDVFAAHLDRLHETHEVVPLDALLRTDAAGARPRAAITFDDAYVGAVRWGAPELARRGLPATIFVAPAFVPGGVFWWDALTLPGATGLAADEREQALTACAGRDAAVRAWAAARGLAPRALPPEWAVAAEADLQATARLPGFALGSHSWSHANLTRLDHTDLADEMRRPLAWLRERFTNVSSVLAYPYGLSSPGVEAAAAAAGYSAGLLVSGGARRGVEPPFRLPRLNVPAGLSPNGFTLRAAGLLAR